MRVRLVFKSLFHGDPRLARPEGRDRYLVFLEGLALLGGIGMLDWLITSDISVSVFYVVPVSLVAWTLGRGGGMVMSLLAAAVWYVAEYHGKGVHSREAVLWQCLSRLCFYVVIAWLVDRVRLLQLNLENLVKSRTAELEAEILRRKELERETAEVAEREQERVATELHDELAAYLSGIAFRGKLLAESLTRRNSPESADASNLVTLVNNATDKVCNFARMLAVTESTHDTLAEALSRLGSEAETVFGVTCVVEVPDLPATTKDHCGQLYRIAREAVRNAVQHSRSDLIQISVTQTAEGLTLSVICNGKVWELSGQPSKGLGLRIMRQRSERLGGKLTIQPQPSGGAIVRCELPLIRPPELAAGRVPR